MFYCTAVTGYLTLKTSGKVVFPWRTDRYGKRNKDNYDSVSRIFETFGIP
jgi:hypothetical protein